MLESRRFFIIEFLGFTSLSRQTMADATADSSQVKTPTESKYGRTFLSLLHSSHRPDERKTCLDKLKILLYAAMALSAWVKFISRDDRHWISVHHLG